MAQFNFGSNVGNTAATPNFGFGAKPAAPTFGSLAPAQPTGSITFGTPIASVAPTLQTQSTGLNFGSPAPNFSLGAPAGGTPGTGLSFGAQPAKPGGLSFGTPTSTPASFALNFGGTATPASSSNAPLGGLSFGATTPASSGFTLGTSTAPTLGTGLFGGTPASTATPTLGLSFGAPATSAPSTGFNLGGTPGPASTFSLGLTSTTATTTASTGLSFGAPTSTPGLNFSFGGAKSQAAPTLTLGSTTTQAPSLGLGGIDTSQNKSGAVTTGGTSTVAGKENPAPNEILQTIEGFKNFVKEQKVHSSDVSRGSARPFLKVGEDIDMLNSLTSEVGNELQRHQQIALKLKNDSAKCLHDAEMAQRTYDTPPGLQFENVAPMQYFIDLVNKFEQDLQAIRIQIDVTDKHVQSLSEPRFLTSQELSMGMRKLHDTFVALAGRLQSVHTQVETQKEQYLNLRKYILKDPTNIFLKPAKEIKTVDSTLQSFNNSVSGPTPFSSIGAPTGISMMMPQQPVPNKPPPAYPANTSLNFGSTSAQLPSSTLLSSVPTLGANTSLFGNTTLGQTTDSSFQLQNPPLGNKRGKR